MDVGQVFGTATEPARRESERYRNDSEDFASYLDEQNPESEKASAKERTPTDQSTASSDDSLNRETTFDKGNSAVTTAENAADNEMAERGKNDDNSSSPVAAPLHTSSSSDATSNTANSKTGSAGLSTAAAMAVQEALSGTSTHVPTGSLKKDETTSTQVASQSATAMETGNKKSPGANAAGATTLTSNEKTPAMSPSDAKAALDASDVLSNLRAEATSKMSKKDILSSKIAEMLQDGNGKISLTATKQQQNIQTTLTSSTNLFTAALTNNTGATTPNALAFAGGDLDGAISQAPPTPSVGAQGISLDSSNQTIPTAPTGSVQGVDATASNNMSQTANAARAGHLPVAEQISTQVSAAIKEGQDRIKISLHPSELGRVEVKLDIGHDGRVLAVVSVDKQETLDLLQRDARSLERALQDAGFDTGSNSLNFSLNQNGQESEGEDTNFSNLDVSTNELKDGDDLAPLPLRAPPGGNGDSNLDIQV
ncbi:flagellar hook-length control protein FliK [Sneathiella litorea]|uniref:Flagellar hook-length control protein-like C-terminal domain-containing protein n=1 Tax=Sneathiella litorea TaxID=2606216 RepID=A0A6L8W504_9PROT|nr:flagellar hook-length control protein FliK [Sneathiella litorea]MZR30205.1 hypothetical protein [Sneathiella litorea]